MKVLKISLTILSMLLSSVVTTIADTPEPSNHIGYPVGWQTWSVIAVSHRTDNNTSRVILGNPIAVEAARTGKVDPWPDGAVLGKIVWKDRQLNDWKAATAPGEFVHAEFMFRDSKKYSETFGWGWARWLGQAQKPFNDGGKSCITCHTPVKNRNWVFTDPAVFPTLK